MNLFLGGGKTESHVPLFLGQDVGAILEAMYEALWQECISASYVLRHQGIGKPLCRRQYVNPKREYVLLYKSRTDNREQCNLWAKADHYHR